MTRLALATLQQERRRWRWPTAPRRSPRFGEERQPPLFRYRRSRLEE